MPSCVKFEVKSIFLPKSHICIGFISSFSCVVNIMASSSINQNLLLLFLILFCSKKLRSPTTLYLMTSFPWTGLYTNKLCLWWLASHIFVSWIVVCINHSSTIILFMSWILRMKIFSLKLNEASSISIYMIERHNLAAK